MVKFSKSHTLFYLILIASSILLCFDLFTSRGQPANMDGTVHVQNIAIFYEALKQGDFPVGWTDGFANYGLPMGYFAQQSTSYLGALLTFVTHNPLTSFNLVYLVGTITSACLMFSFLRLCTTSVAALAGSLLFQFAPYRIINIYIRGALPEYFSSVFVLLILICMVKLSQRISYRWFFLCALGVAGVILTHPMNVVTSLVLLIPFGIWLFFHTKRNYHFIFSVIFSSLLGLTLTGYYLFPLILEIKYFYYGLMQNYLTPNSTLGLDNFISPAWPYFNVFQNNIISRGHFIKTGVIETVIMFISLVFMRKQDKHKAVFGLFLFVGLSSLFLTTSLAEPLYTHMRLLAGIQFPWRMLSTFIFIPPFLAAIMIDNFKLKTATVLVLVTVVFIARFPQSYGKNVSSFTPESYTKTVDNPHNISMNPIWSGPSLSYPQKAVHGEIIEGNGVIVNRSERNSVRMYSIEATTPLRMSDNTFYFPGWTVLVDGAPQEIQYQDPNYRGVITYQVPDGTHTVSVSFQDTKVRRFGKYASLLGVGMLFGCFFLFRVKGRINHHTSQTA